MLTQTSLSGIRALVYLALRDDDVPISPRQMAGPLQLSPSYLAKVTGLLAKSDLVRSHRGVKGGVTLSRPPEAISLLEVIESCQGKLLGDYCREEADLGLVCSFHRIMVELKDAQTQILTRWTIADLASKPTPSGEILDHECRMGSVFKLCGSVPAAAKHPE